MTMATKRKKKSLQNKCLGLVNSLIVFAYYIVGEES